MNLFKKIALTTLVALSSAAYAGAPADFIYFVF